VLRADRSLAWFPVVSGLATLGAAALIFGPAAAIYSSSGSSEAVIIVAAVIGAFVLTWIAVFFNTALAAAASKSLAGQDTTMNDGFAVARARIGVITQWAIVQATIGLILTAIREALSDNLIGQIFAGLLDFAWAAATFFVIPVLALEGAGPRDAFKRSVSVLKGRWGEGVVGTVSVSAVVFLIVMLPAILVGAPSLGGKPVGDNRFYGANDPRRNSGLAQGYLGLPELTRERFLPDKFQDDASGAKIYRTGDIVRTRPGRRLEFLGRDDRQKGGEGRASAH